jgi:uncharacterized protein (DUF924 family)
MGKYLRCAPSFATAVLRFELRHQAIIHRFGRYPHRNAILGRPPEALAFLAEPGSSLQVF